MADTIPVLISKNYRIIGVVILIAISSFVVGSQITGKSITPQQAVQTKQSCPSECCINDPNYENRVCQGSNYQCVNNKCVKTNCPYECCSEGEYSAKLCLADYDCQNNKCAAIDSDKDGLTNIEEKQFGTNINLADSDGDTSSDYQEVRVLRTNPLNVNTDSDRYNDNVDTSPTTINSANIVVLKSNGKGERNYLNIIKDGAIVAVAASGLTACTAGTMGACAAVIPSVAIALDPILNDVIYTSGVDITFNNEGNDYTSFINYDVVYSIETKQLQTISKSTGRLDPGMSITIPFFYNIKVKDIQYGSTWDLILGKNNININIENVKFGN